MGAYFQNTLLPKAAPEAVCEAISRWHADAGYTATTGRQLFGCDTIWGESRLFVVSNAQWCVVLWNRDTEEYGQLRCALNQFPAVLQLWARDGVWGYRMDEFGKWMTSYSSKGIKNPDESLPRKPGDIELLAAACGVPSAGPKLRRLERSHFFLTQKACAEFAETLNAPVAAMHFYDLDGANAGISEPRTFQGWTIRMLSFRKSVEKLPFALGTGLNLTAEEREAVRQKLNRIRERMKRARQWISPAATLAGLVVLPLIGILWVLMLLSRIPGLRRVAMGKSTRVCEDLLEEVRAAEPAKIQIQGEVAVNTRHGCSIVAAGPARVLPKFLPRKGLPHEDPIFDIQINGHTLSCMGYAHQRLPRWHGVTVLEKQEFLLGDGTGGFERWQSHPQKPWAHYQWTLKAAQACYQFTCVTEQELAQGELEAMDRIVRSFKIQPVAGVGAAP